MSKKQEFINFIEQILKETKLEMNEEARFYWEALKQGKTSGEKPMLTEAGTIILKFLKDNIGCKMWTSKAISEQIELSSRKIAGSMRKLCSDGFVEKLGDSPAVYVLTEKGKEIKLN